MGVERVSLPEFCAAALRRQVEKSIRTAVVCDTVLQLQINLRGGEGKPWL